MNLNKPSKNTLQPWILGARPKTLPAAISPVVIGIGISIYYHAFRPSPAIAALICAVFIQIGTNFTNDVVDFLHGHDQADRLGPVRVTQAGLLTPRQVIGGAVTAFSLAALAGLYLAITSGWIVILIGAACILAGLAYSTGPFPLVENGLADLVVLVFFGFVAVVSTVYVITLSLPVESWLGGLAAGVLTVNILVVNNVRDIVSDKRAGRKNIAVLFGRRAGETEYRIMQIIAYLVPIALFFVMGFQPWILVTYLTLPAAIRDYQNFRKTPSGKELNLQLGKTGQLLFFYGLAMTAGFILARFAG